MRSYLETTLAAHAFPKEFHPELLGSYDALIKNPISKEIINSILSDYEGGKNPTLEGVCDKIKELAVPAGVHSYTAAAVVFLLLTKHLCTLYSEEGYTEQMYGGILADIKYKLIECKLVKGIVGTFVASWFVGFFAMRRFCFGRLQFEPFKISANCKLKNLTLKEGDGVINVHIPRTGTRLDAKSCECAYSAAAEFFKKKYGIPPVFRCKSWLLFPKHREILNPDSNILAFMNKYEVIDQGTYEDYKEIWRLFDMDYTGNPNELPCDSSIRRAYIALMKSSEPTGWAEGIYVFEN